MLHIDETLISSLIIPRPADGHKGTFGHALIMAGSPGKTGAAILSSMAVLRTGCGLLSVYTAMKAVVPILCHLPEAMIIPRKKKVAAPDTRPFDAIGFGPGIGLDNAVAQLLSSLLKNYDGPLIIDADGLTLLSQYKEWYGQLSPQMILTPHPVEFDRLTRSHDSTEDRIVAQLAFAKEHNVIVILKGHRTTIAFPHDELYCNTTGNNGMATAGSGDVLTGIITSLCAQGYTAKSAALIGVFLHGYAGDAAAEQLSRTSMIASDIVAAIPSFFRKFEQAPL